MPSSSNESAELDRLRPLSTETGEWSEDEVLPLSRMRTRSEPVELLLVMVTEFLDLLCQGSVALFCFAKDSLLTWRKKRFEGTTYDMYQPRRHELIYRIQ